MQRHAHHELQPQPAAHRGVDLDGLLARARTAGEVRTFSYEPPKLSELFMEAVTPEAAAETREVA